MSSILNEILNAANIAHDMRDYENAIILYEKALNIDSNLPQVYVKIGNICLELEALNDALLYYEQALLLDKESFVAYSNIATVFQKNNQLTEALEYYDKALKINPNYVSAHYNLSYVLLMQKDYLKGFSEYRYRYHKEIIGDKIGGVVYPPTLLTPQDDFTDKVVYISHEQGLGDTIEFIRFLPFFTKKAKKVLCYVPPSLVKLFTLNYPDVYFTSSIPDINFDFNFPMLESPYLLGTTYEKIPFGEGYLQVDKNDLSDFQKKHNFPTDKIKIGINYRGSQTIKHSALKLEQLLPIFQELNDEYKLYSLQYDRTKEEEILLEENKIENLGKYIENFYDTALMIESLDVIVTIDTALVHLAGALGKKTFALLKFNPDWRWGLYDENTNWYKSVTLLRQSTADTGDNGLTDLLPKLQELK